MAGDGSDVQVDHAVSAVLSADAELFPYGPALAAHAGGGGTLTVRKVKNMSAPGRSPPGEWSDSTKADWVELAKAVKAAAVEGRAVAASEVLEDADLAEALSEFRARVEEAARMAIQAAISGAAAGTAPPPVSRPEGPPAPREGARLMGADVQVLITRANQEFDDGVVAQCDLPTPAQMSVMIVAVAARQYIPLDSVSVRRMRGVKGAQPAAVADGPSGDGGPVSLRFAYDAEVSDARDLKTAEAIDCIHRKLLGVLVLQMSADDRGVLSEDEVASYVPGSVDAGRQNGKVYWLSKRAVNELIAEMRKMCRTLPDAGELVFKLWEDIEAGLVEGLRKPVDANARMSGTLAHHLRAASDRMRFAVGWTTGVVASNVFARGTKRNASEEQSQDLQKRVHTLEKQVEALSKSAVSRKDLHDLREAVNKKVKGVRPPSTSNKMWMDLRSVEPPPAAEKKGGKPGS